MVGAPALTGLADSTQRHRLVMSLCMGIMIALLVLLTAARAFVPVLLLILAYAFFNAPIVPFSDSATLTMLGGKRDLYGRIRMGGTIGFGIMAPLAGLLVENQGLRWAFWCSALLLIAALLVSQRFAFHRAAPGDPTHGGLGVLLANRRWVLFLAMAFACGVGFASINAYLYPTMRQMGASESTMGLAATIATLVELPVFFFANHILRRLGAFGMLVTGMAVTGVRLLLYAAVTTPAGVLAFQALNGLAFPVVWAGGVAFANENAPPGLSASAQGLFSAMVFGFGAAVGGLIGGLLLESVGGQMMYLVFGIFVLASLAILAPLERRLTVSAPA
jgi:PPP family 3-phenylpropionic acid transporter